MNQSPPLPPAWGPQDESHLNLLSIFYFIFGGLGLLGGGFLAVHYLIMNAFMTGRFGPQTGPQPPQEFFLIMQVMYVVMGFLLVVGTAANLASGLFLRRRRHRIFSMVVAGLNCLQFPLGTALGVFTFIVLLRESVRAGYERAEAEN
jgi:hypothetical protein